MMSCYPFDLSKYDYGEDLLSDPAGIEEILTSIFDNGEQCELYYKLSRFFDTSKPRIDTLFDLREFFEDIGQQVLDQDRSETAAEIESERLSEDRMMDKYFGGPR
jgi:hypothetical protein